MDQGDAVRLEADAAVGIRTRRAVLEVALDRAAHVGELAADLVVPAGQQFHFDEMIAVRVGKVPVAEAGEFRSLLRP